MMLLGALRKFAYPREQEFLESVTKKCKCITESSNSIHKDLLILTVLLFGKQNKLCREQIMLIILKGFSYENSKKNPSFCHLVIGII